MEAGKITTKGLAVVATPINHLDHSPPLSFIVDIDIHHFGL